MISGLFIAGQISVLLHQADSELPSQEREEAREALTTTFLNFSVLFVCIALVRPCRNLQPPGITSEHGGQQNIGPAPPEKVASVLQMLKLSAEQRKKIAAVWEIFYDIKEEPVQKLQKTRAALSKLLSMQQDQQQEVATSQQQACIGQQGKAQQQQQQQEVRIRQQQARMWRQEEDQQQQEELWGVVRSQHHMQQLQQGLPTRPQQQQQQQQRNTRIPEQKEEHGQERRMFAGTPSSHATPRGNTSTSCCSDSSLMRGPGAPMDPEDALNPNAHFQVVELTEQLGVLVRKVAWLDSCMAFCVLGTFSWRQMALHVVHMYPYNTALGTWVGPIIAEQGGRGSSGSTSSTSSQKSSHDSCAGHAISSSSSNRSFANRQLRSLLRSRHRFRRWE